MTRTGEIKVKPIGHVKRAFKQEDVRDRSLISEIVLRKDLTEALNGIEGFSHIFVVFYMHQVRKETVKMLKVHPQGRADLPLLGVFATRTAFRPNPIGLTLVELLERKENVLVVRGLDAFDGTPVLDIKPYGRQDMVADAREPKWCNRLHGKE